MQSYFERGPSQLCHVSLQLSWRRASVPASASVSDVPPFSTERAAWRRDSMSFPGRGQYRFSRFVCMGSAFFFFFGPALVHFGAVYSSDELSILCGNAVNLSAGDSTAWVMHISPKFGIFCHFVFQEVRLRGCTSSSHSGQPPTCACRDHSVIRTRR